jgi:hypothetical protein
MASLQFDAIACIYLRLCDFEEQKKRHTEQRSNFLSPSRSIVLSPAMMRDKYASLIPTRPASQRLLRPCSSITLPSPVARYRSLCLAVVTLMRADYYVKT